MNINFDKIAEQYHLRKLTIVFKIKSSSFKKFGRELRATLSNVSEENMLFVMTEDRKFSKLPLQDIEAIKEDEEKTAC
jgi:hypothetical protein